MSKDSVGKEEGDLVVAYGLVILGKMKDGWEYMTMLAMM
jgi:hypothetical protein